MTGCLGIIAHWFIHHDVSMHHVQGTTTNLSCRLSCAEPMFVLEWSGSRKVKNQGSPNDLRVITCFGWFPTLQKSGFIEISETIFWECKGTPPQKMPPCPGNFNRPYGMIIRDNDKLHSPTRPAFFLDKVLGGSSQDLQMANNHGDRFPPQDLWLLNTTFIHGRCFWLKPWGLRPNYVSKSEEPHPPSEISLMSWLRKSPILEVYSSDHCANLWTADMNPVLNNHKPV